METWPARPVTGWGTQAPVVRLAVWYSTPQAGL